METRTLGYVGLGVLVGIIVATLIGLPPVLWIMAALLTLVAVIAVVVARSAGTSDATRMLGQDTSDPAPVGTKPSFAPSVTSAVDVELVRQASDDAPAVWLHRYGGRRVHRFETANGWVVQQVNTKDPDNPKMRVIGEPLTVRSEIEAVHAADDLAQGVRRSEGPKARVDTSTLPAGTFA